MGSPPMNFLMGTVIKMSDKFYFQNGPFKVHVPDSFREKIAPYENQEIVFGIRSEDIYDKLFATEASADNTVRAICEVVEPMGAEAYLYLRTGPNTFIARVWGLIHPKVNQDLDLVIDMNKAHFFDKTTEQSIV